jgi:CO dehydrogenase/acetyl-CoA synthase alpha subunit
LVQAGAFGEHRFTTARDGEVTHEVHGKHLLVTLAPAAQLTLDLGVQLNVSQPSYQFPW